MDSAPFSSVKDLQANQQRMDDAFALGEQMMKAESDAKAAQNAADEEELARHNKYILEQELAAANGLTAPEYEIGESGPDHDKKFTVGVYLGKTFDESKKRPLYVINRRTFDLENLN